MDANHVADIIVSSVKKSKLNFHITESPFSLLINLRKTFIKDKNGNSLLPHIDIFDNGVNNEEKVEEAEKSCLNDTLEKLDAELKETRDSLREQLVKIEKHKNEITELQMKANKFAKEAQKQKDENETLKLDNDDLCKEIETLKADKNISMKVLQFKNNEIKKLESKNNNLEEKIKTEKIENNCLLDENKNLETQIVSLKKPVIKNVHKSTSTRAAIKIESQTQTDMESTFATLQSMDASHIRLDIESGPSLDSPPDPGPAPSNNQCNSRQRCEHRPQCILREPRPPPSPTITFLHNERSKYHQHMMLWTKKEFDGHSRCFAVENENYGCDDCTWLKWWYKWHGENHGFPDIPEWTYRKYL